MRSPGFLCARINGQGWSNYGTNEAGKEICQPSGIEWNIAEKYWILEQTCVSARRGGGGTKSEAFWRLEIVLGCLVSGFHLFLVTQQQPAASG